jgi:Spy/CpxP family protein refolding chaperone
LQGKTSALLIAATLVAGLVIGFAGSTLAYRYGWLHVHGRYLLQRMDRELALTPAQHEQIEDVMEGTHEKMHELRLNLRDQRRRLMISTYLKIRSLLTPDQQKTFDSRFVPPRLRSEAEQLRHGVVSQPPGVPEPQSVPSPVAS